MTNPNTTQRGFEIIERVDRYSQEYTLQQSSLAFVGGEDHPPGAGAVWLGSRAGRMHLTRPMVAELIGMLSRWHATGSFAEAAPSEDDHD